MIVLPRHLAPARLALPDAVRRRTRIAHGLIAGLILLSLPGAAQAAGGVAITRPTTTKANAADAATTPATQPAAPPQSVAKNQVRRAQTLMRLSPTGANDAPTRKAVKRFQQLRGLAPYGIIDLGTYVQIKDAFALLETGGAGIDVAIDPAAAAGGASVTATSPAPPLVLPPNLAPITAAEHAILDKVAQCESQGNPAAVSADGRYHGKYQFDRKTWKAVGGTGDPAAASEVEQDQRAAILLRQRGTAPWPICSSS